MRAPDLLAGAMVLLFRGADEGSKETLRRSSIALNRLALRVAASDVERPLACAVWIIFSPCHRCGQEEHVLAVEPLEARQRVGAIAS